MTYDGAGNILMAKQENYGIDLVTYGGFMWKEINTDKDIQCLMSAVDNFHDSCVKEIKYISGAYVNSDMSMYPINDCRLLNVVIQRQSKDLSMIELEFEGLKFIKLFPIADTYTCEITDATLFFKDGYIYWCDHDIYAEGDAKDFEGTMICALKLRWRSIDNKMGTADYYCS